MQAEQKQLEGRLTAVLEKHQPGFERLVTVERLSGGASQETYRIQIIVNGSATKLAMRRLAGGEAGAESPDRPGLAIEAKLMQIAGAAGVPEPEILHVLQDDDGLGAGFLMQWLDGETLGSKILRAPELDGIRPKLAFECGQILARIHNIDIAATGLDQDLKTVSTEQFIHQLWDEYKGYGSPQPMIDYTARWLLDNLPENEEYRLVHNDFRNGNIMVTPDGINAVLDWEIAHIGDPIRDLGWICTNSWRFGRRENMVGGFGQLDELLAGYKAESGRDIVPAHVHFWTVFGSYWWAIGCIGMAEKWRNGPDASVERPGIARRSSECQVDCANMIIPGPVTLVTETAPASVTDAPRIDELLISVRDFLRNDIRPAVEGRNNFMALVASNSLDIVLRELAAMPAHLSEETARLKVLLDEPGYDVMALRRQLCDKLQSGDMGLDQPGLADHLRQTIVNQLAIDQPKYSGLAEALERSDQS